ncbi:MAG: rhomboid family intramembrane serine protease [Deltaproteobacteria bacterium]|nr:rhomboid family intramembrane serine protease [Deltaproteobacteria bacterium]
MIPIRDTVPSKTYPVVNTALIGINVLVFLFQMTQGRNLPRFNFIYGLVPARYTAPHIAEYFSMGQQVLSLLSFMFLHGGFWHLLGNMWSLYIFGDNVEDRLGPIRYLVFYLLCGLTSGLAHMMFNPSSKIPTIGASGAIAGVMGAYILLYPRSRILTLIPILFIPWFIEIPAFFFLGIWFLIQFVNAAGSTGAMSGIAWWAHVGGFLCGMIFLKFFKIIPEAGVSDRLRKMTAKKKSEKLQVIRPTAAMDDLNQYGTIRLSPHEVLTGTQKLVNVPWGYQKRLIRVTVPPGMKEGGVLRLKGLGKIMPDGNRGDLMLKVVVDAIYRTVN